MDYEYLTNLCERGDIDRAIDFIYERQRAHSADAGYSSGQQRVCHNMPFESRLETYLAEGIVGHIRSKNTQA